jgi:hypothetical protein
LQDINPRQLDIRTHDEMLNNIDQIEQLEGNRKENLASNYG